MSTCCLGGNNGRDWVHIGCRLRVPPRDGRNPGTQACQVCAAGSYGAGTPPCVTCPGFPNTTTSGISPATSSADCECSPGYFLSVVDDGCSPCPVGEYKEGIGNSQNCAQCDGQESTFGWGSSAVTDCVCKPGFFRLTPESACQPCPFGNYSTGLNTTGSCTACPAGFTTAKQTATSVSDCSACLPNHWGPTCTPAPALRLEFVSPG